MGLETGDFPNQLNENWPLSGDEVRFGDDHLRLVKHVLRSTFPNVTGAVTPTQAELNQLDGVDLSNFDAATLNGEGNADFHDAAQLTGNIPAASVPEAVVTQHEGALAISAPQIVTPVVTKNASF